MISLSESAVRAVTRFIESSETPVTGLRISVAGGGCSGFQYSLRLEEAQAMEDTVVNVSDELRSVDFVESVEGAGFKFHNPNATASCGCGNSFTV